MTDEEMIRQVHQAMFGIAGTDEKGMIGDIKDIKITVKGVCDDQNKLKGTVHNLIWFLVGTGVLTGTSISIAITKLVSG